MFCKARTEHQLHLASLACKYDFVVPDAQSLRHVGAEDASWPLHAYCTSKLTPSASSIPIRNNCCAPIQHASLCRLTSQVCHKRSWPPPWARCWPPCCPLWNSSWATSTSSQLGNLAPPHRQPKGLPLQQGPPDRSLLHLLHR